MFAGWRLELDDVELLNSTGGGEIEIEILSGRTANAAGEELPLHIGKELRGWFEHRLAAHSIPLGQIEEAPLQVDYSAGERASKRSGLIRLNFDCRSLIRTDEAEYRGGLRESVAWQFNKSS